MNATAYFSDNGEIAGKACTGNCGGCGWKMFAEMYPAETYYVEIINARGKLHYSHGIKPASFEKQKEHRITLTKSGVISVYIDTKAMAKDIAGWINDGISFTYEFN